MSLNSTRELSKVDASVAVTQNTVENGLLPDLMRGAHPDFRSILSSYTISFRQLESLWNDTDISLELYRPVAKKPTAIAGEIPYLLSTIIGPEEKDAIITAEEGEIDSNELLEQIEKYNNKLEDVLSTFSEMSDQINAARASEK